MARSIADLDLIGQRAESMALKITGLMESTRRTSDLDELHALVQDLVVIRQAVLALKEAAPAGPRVFNLPDAPEDLRQVTDVLATGWHRTRSDLWADGSGGATTWENLLWQNAPLTEVIDDGRA